MSSSPTRKRHIPDQWFRTVLTALYREPTITRSEILKTTGLNAASLSHCLKQLIKAGLVLRVEKLGAKPGRPADLLHLNSEAALFVAVDLEASPIRFAVTNLRGEILHRWEEGDPADAMNVALIVRGVEKVCRPLTQHELDSVLAVAICRPGIADADGRVTSVNLGWKQFPFEEKVAAALPKRVFVENGARAYILAEHWLGSARNVDNCIYVEVGRGVGGAILFDGQFFRGRRQAEFGHITIEPGASDLCKCGKAGCLEAISSAHNVVRQYRERTKARGVVTRVSTVSQVIDRARSGDPDALAVIDRAMRALGLGLSYLLATFNPELIIMGGYFMGDEDFLLPRLRHQLAQHEREWTCPYELVVSNLGMDIGLRGASALAFYRTLDRPELLRRICEPRASVRSKSKSGRS